MKARLTSGRLDAFSCPAGRPQAFLRDSETPGLALRVTAADARSFVFEGKLNRRTVRITIGDVEHWRIGEARARARELAALLDRGIDPREQMARERATAAAERERQRAAQAPALEAWTAYCEERHTRWSAHHLRDHYRLSQAGGQPKRRGAGTTQPGPLAELLSEPLTALTAERIERWADKHAKARPAVARLALRLFGAFLNWCRAHPQYRRALPDGDPTKSRRAREALGRPQAKRDALMREQLAPWFAAVRTLPAPIAAYLQALLLTGARPGELRALRWESVDLRWKRAVIRDKVEGERVIPLTPFVAALLAALPRRGAFVFCGRAGDKPISAPARALARACAIAGVPHVTLHGLRRSFKSLSEWVEVPTGVVAQIMGHKPTAIAERHYTVRPLDLLAQWHTKIEAWILQQAGIEQPTEESARLLRVVSK